MKDGKSDLIMLLTDDNAYTVEVQQDALGEFIVLPDEILPHRKERIARLRKKDKS